MSYDDFLDVEGVEEHDGETQTHAASTVASLVPITQTSLVRPAGSVADIATVFDEYQALQTRLLDDSDYQNIGGKRFPKRSAWRKLSVAFGVTFHILERTIHRDRTGSVLWAEFVVRALAPGGRYADGWGSCSLRGENRDFSKPNHDIPATAETRAKNRAAADLFGMGDVSAEEVGNEVDNRSELPVGITVDSIEGSKQLKARLDSTDEIILAAFRDWREGHDFGFVRGYGYPSHALTVMIEKLDELEAETPDTQPPAAETTGAEPTVEAGTEPFDTPAAEGPTLGDLHAGELTAEEAAAAATESTEPEQPKCPTCHRKIGKTAKTKVGDDGLTYHDGCEPF